jgi:hypothetical protein
MPSEPLSMCSVCGRPPASKALRLSYEARGGAVPGICYREALVIAECERIGRERAESRLAEALEALHEVGCIDRALSYNAKPRLTRCPEALEPADWCSVCRVLAGTPPGPAPATSQSGSNRFQSAPALVSRDAVLEEAAREADACARERRAQIESLPAYAPPEREAAYHSLRGKEGEALRIAERVRLLKSKEPAAPARCDYHAQRCIKDAGHDGFHVFEEGK